MVSVVKYRNSLLRPIPLPYRNGELPVGIILVDAILVDGPIHFVVGTGKCRRRLVTDVTISLVYFLDMLHESKCGEWVAYLHTMTLYVYSGPV